MSRSVFTVYSCEDCRESVIVEAKSRDLLPMSAECPKCGGIARSKCPGDHGMNAYTGEIRSTNLGCGIGQEAEGNRALAESDIDAHYDTSNGDLVAANRQAFLEAQASRGMVSQTDGGHSTPKLRRIRQRSLAGNPKR